MANQQEATPLALAITLAQELRQRQAEFREAHMLATSDIARQVSHARKRVDQAEAALSTHGHVILSETALIVASVEEIQTLMDLLRNDRFVRSVQHVVVRGPVPDGNRVDPAVAVLRNALVREGFELQEGNIYSVPNHLRGGAVYQATAALRAPAAEALNPLPATADPPQLPTGGQGGV